MTAHGRRNPRPTGKPDGRYLVGLIGEGITASLTPPMHEAEALALGLDYEYRVLDLIELGRAADAVGDLLEECRDAGFTAVNVTHPCKQLVLELVDELAPDAERVGAVNLVVFDGARATGYNTDWMGYLDGLEAGLPGASLECVVQIGCGGAGAATAYALLSAGAGRLDLTDTDDARASELAARMRAVFPTQTIRTILGTDLPGALSEATGVVHTTPTGMVHHPGVAFEPELLPDHAWVSDVVYRPLDTELLRRAADRGHPVLDGGRMAVGQACASLRIITGATPDRDRVERHFRALIAAEGRAGAAGGGLR